SFGDRLEVPRAAEQGDVVSGLAEESAEYRADGSASSHQDATWLRHDSAPVHPAPRQPSEKDGGRSQERNPRRLQVLESRCWGSDGRGIAHRRSEMTFASRKYFR